MTELKHDATLPKVQSASAMVAAAKAEIREVQPEEVAELMRQGAALLDIRELEEIRQSGVIPGALVAPRSSLEWSVDPESPTFVRELDPSRPVLAYCRSGNRSAFVAQLMMRMGYRDVRSLQGGIRRWIQEGRPVAAPGT